jgi:hypothetical protein
MSEPATDADYASRRSRSILQKRSSIEHGIPLEQKLARSRQTISNKIRNPKLEIRNKPRERKSNVIQKSDMNCLRIFCFDHLKLFEFGNSNLDFA